MRTGLSILLLTALALSTSVPVLAQQATDPDVKKPATADLDAADTEVVEAALRQRIATADENEPVRVIIWLTGNPVRQIVREERAKVAEELAANAAAVQERFRILRPEGSLTEEQEQAFVRNRGFRLGPEEDSFVDIMVDRQEALQDQWRKAANERIRAATQQQRSGFEPKLELLGASEVTWLLTAHAYSALLPAGAVGRLAEWPEVARVSEYVTPEIDLNTTKESLGLTSTYWPEGMDGRGWDIGVIDGGFQQNHPNLAPRDGFVTPPGYSSSATRDHGTAVAGAIFSNHSSYRGGIFDLHTATLGGTAVGATGIGNTTEHADWMVTTASQKPEVINGSFSSRAADSSPLAYNDTNRFWDSLADDNPVTLVFTSGNSGPARSVGTPGNGYNTLSVANVNDRGTVSRSDDRIASSSSRGPAEDGRKKPDIAAPGTNIHTANAWWDDTCIIFPGDCPNFKDMSGTSFAAPQVAAAAMLVVEQRGDREPTAIRAALINSANAWSDNNTSGVSDDFPLVGTAWNPTYGWGYMNVGATFFNATDVFTDSIGDGNALDSNRLYRGPNFRWDKSTLVWNRHGTFDGANGTNSMLPLTDLDLAIYTGTGDFLFSSTSSIDNVEQVVCPNNDWCIPSSLNVSLPVVLKVSTWGSIHPSIGQQRYSLATEEGFSRIQPPRLAFQSISFNPPLSAISPGQAFNMEATVANVSPDLEAPSSEVGLSLGFTSIILGSAVQSFGTLSASSSTRTASWRLRAACNTSENSIATYSTARSYGETWAVSAPTQRYTPNTVTLQNHVTGSYLPRTYDFQVPAGGYTAFLFRPDSGNLYWALDDSLCITSPWVRQTTAISDSSVVLFNPATTGSGTRYVRPGRDGTVGSSPYHLNRATSVPVPAASGQRADQLAYPDRMLKVVELTGVQAGRGYRVTLDNGSGLDGSLYVFDPSLTFGDTAAADWRSENAGLSVDESVTFTAPVSGSYAVLIKRQSGGGSFTLRSTDVTPRSIQVRSSGANSVSVTATPSTYSGTTDYTIANLTSSDPIALEAPFSLGNVEFVSWTGCNSVSGTTCTVAPTGDRTVTVQYASIGHTLQVATSGANGVAIAGAPAEFGGSTPYARDRIDTGTLITLTAPATHGPLGFVEWIGCDAVYGDDLRSCEMVINSNRSARATYDDTSDDLFRDNFEGNLPSLPPPPPPPPPG